MGPSSCSTQLMRSLNVRYNLATFPLGVRGFLFRKMGMKSSAADGYPVNSRNNVPFTGFSRKEDDFPSLSEGVRSKHPSRRRTTIDLGGSTPPSRQMSNTTSTSVTYGDQPERNIHISPSITPESDVMQVKEEQKESSTCVKLNGESEYDTDLPESFGKKRAPYNPPKPLSHEGRGWSKRSANKFPPKQTVDEPFNICFPDRIRKSKGGQVLRPGMVLFKNYISISGQVDIVRKCEELCNSSGSGGFYRPGYKDGAKLRLHMMCLGLDWDPQTRTYGEKRKHDGAAPPDIPDEFASLVRNVLDDSQDLIKREMKVADVEDVLPKMSPDLCIVNFYNTAGRLGLHQDRDESWESLDKGLPVVSISIGDSAKFLYSDNRDADKAGSVLLESGDVLVFGGESRLVFHGVSYINPKTAPKALLQESRLRPGRLNLTFRKY